eukprot:TRINITY_DN20228_c0_g2_i1.p1 TRINITY_DN20228_c0_g2~~TRINITY_DN20228_c0_g2_i1.p1  ORF type:complete len:408 (-),score=98.94 TRINITY_DN20228_c0_g2_i1:158-1381(-)
MGLLSSELGLNREKELFLASVIPPMVGALCALHFARGKPQSIMNKFYSLIPGLERPEFVEGGTVIRLRFQEGFDIVNQAKDIFTELKGGLNNPPEDEDEESPRAALRRDDTAKSLLLQRDETSGLRKHKTTKGLTDDAMSKMKEVAREASHTELYVIVSHLWLVLVVPANFLALYFWDSAILAREATSQFPLNHCMGLAECFYIKQDYNVFRYPDYQQLDCEAMRQRTTSSEDGFYFIAPSDAKFYKCYTWIVTVPQMVGCIGDVIAIAAVLFLVVVYFCVSAAKVDVTNARTRLRETRCYQVLCIAFGVGSMFLMNMLYGKVTTEFEIYLLGPVVCTQGFLLLECRKEILMAQLAAHEGEQGWGCRCVSDSGDSAFSSSETDAPDVAAARPRGVFPGISVNRSEDL